MERKYMTVTRPKEKSPS